MKYRTGLVVESPTRIALSQEAGADLIVTRDGIVIKDRYGPIDGLPDWPALSLATMLPNPPKLTTPPKLPVPEPQDPWDSKLLDDQYELGEAINEARWAACNYQWSWPGMQSDPPSMEFAGALADKIVRAFLGITGPEDDERFEEALNVFENRLNECQ